MADQDDINALRAAAQALVDHVNELKENQRELAVRRRTARKIDRDGTSRRDDALNTTLEALEVALAGVEGDAPATSESAETAGPTDRPVAAQSAAADRDDEIDGERKTIAEFFDAVANGLVGAQSSLDRRSEEYLASIAGRQHLNPAVFRLPKVSAEIKFGISNITSEGMNLLFYRRSAEEQQFQEHSMQFEIVSAPPPVELVNDLSQLALRLDFLITASARSSVRARLNEATRGAGGSQAPVAGLLAALDERPASVIVFTGSAGTDTYLLGHYVDAAEDRTALFLWVLEAAADVGDGEDELTCLWKASTSSAPGDRLLAHLQPAFDKQQAVRTRVSALVDLAGTGVSD